MDKLEKVREEIADYFRLHSREGDCPCEAHQRQIYEWADYILSLPDILVKDEHQNLPNPYMDIRIWRDYSPDMAYEKAQEDMLSNNWVKVINVSLL